MDSLTAVPELDLSERTAVALSEAADQLASAFTHSDFVAALEANYRVWTAVERISRRRGWTVPPRSTAQFALKTSARGGRGVTDAHVEALIRAGRDVSLALAGGDIESVRARARLLRRYASPLAWLAMPPCRKEALPQTLA